MAVFCTVVLIQPDIQLLCNGLCLLWRFFETISLLFAVCKLSLRKERTESNCDCTSLQQTLEAYLITHHDLSTIRKGSTLPQSTHILIMFVDFALEASKQQLFLTSTNPLTLCYLFVITYQSIIGIITKGSQLSLADSHIQVYSYSGHPYLAF